MFLNQVVHSFPTMFYEQRITKARTDEKNVEVKLERARGAVQRGVDEKFWPRAKIKRNWLRKRRPVVIAVIHHLDGPI